MTRALLLPLLLTAAASAQVVVLPDAQAGPEPAPVLGLSGLDCSAGATATVTAPGALVPAPMLQFGTATGATIPNVCRDAVPLAVLPNGVRFRTDPLPPSEDDDLGRQLLREQGADPSNALYRLQADIEWLREQQRHGSPARRLEVALPAHRP